MSKKHTFRDKVNHLLFGQASSRPDAANLQLLREVDQKLDLILGQLNGQSADAPSEQSATKPQLATVVQSIQLGVDDLAEQIRKQAKTQFKTNTVQAATLDRLQAELDQQKTEMEEQCEKALQAAQLETTKNLFPVLDALDAAFDTGRRQILHLSMPDVTRQATIAWLDGVRLARIRLLDILSAQEISPIPTVGHLFDPHRHIATATDNSGQAPDGIIVSQDRAGYMLVDQVLRFAEVVVSRRSSE